MKKSKDKYHGYFKTKSGKEVYYVYGKIGFPRRRRSTKKYNCLYKTIVGDINITCDFLRLKCVKITKKEYDNF